MKTFKTDTTGPQTKHGALLSTDTVGTPYVQYWAHSLHLLSLRDLIYKTEILPTSLSGDVRIERTDTCMARSRLLGIQFMLN